MIIIRKKFFLLCFVIFLICCIAYILFKYDYDEKEVMALPIGGKVIVLDARTWR